MIIANWALLAWLAIYHLIFNAHLWNNCQSAPNPSICFLLVDFHIFQELIFEKKKNSEMLNPFFFLRAIKVTEIFNFLRAISPAGQIFVSRAH